MCKAFIGIPSITLFHYFFRLKPQPNEATPIVVGRAGFQLRSRKREEYIKYTLPDTHKNWKKGWFYVGNHTPPLAEADGYSTRSNGRWTEPPLEAEKEQIQIYIDTILALKEVGLTGGAVVAN